MLVQILLLPGEFRINIYYFVPTQTAIFHTLSGRMER